MFEIKNFWYSTYSNEARLSLEEIRDRPSMQSSRTGRYGSTSLKNLAMESSESGSNNLKCLDFNGGSLINLQDQVETSQLRRRSPSLPPIFNKEQQQYFCQLVFSVISLNYIRHITNWHLLILEMFAKKNSEYSMQ